MNSSYSQQGGVKREPLPSAVRMERLIPVINHLQDVMSSVGVSSSITGASTIDLPQIAVVGSQSVGKSSVLESLIGRDFLPRGQGIVTRRPLILQLRNIQPPLSRTTTRLSQDNNSLFSENQHDKQQPQQGVPSDDRMSSPMDLETHRSDESSIVVGGGPDTSSSKAAPELIEWGEFSHLPEVQFGDFDQIRREIEKETERLTAKHKGVSPVPILLKIYSPHVIDLTLIDLPGIVKVPTGDQPPDIEMQIRRMILSFITRPNCIILAITAANTDLANSDSLQMAREVDPEGKRTLGVLTKCDLMEEDTDAVELLLGRIYPLALGYVGVVCRSQKEINKKIDIRVAFREEERFFKTHHVYRSIAHRCGTRHLAVMLNQILMHHIQQTLPELKHRIHTLIQDYEIELQTYGDPLLEVQDNAGALLLHFFSKFTRNFQDAIEGRINLANGCDQLAGGARINYIFHDWFGKALNLFDPLDGLNDLEIRIAIKNSTGPKAALFIPERAFEILVRKQISKLEAPALQCVEQVYEELQRIVEKCELSEMQRFSVLRQRLLEVVRGVLKKCLSPTNQMISNLIQMELAYFNTNHPDFVRSQLVSQDTHSSTPQPAAASAPGDGISTGRDPQQVQQQQVLQLQQQHQYRQQLLTEQQMLQEAAMLVTGSQLAHRQSPTQQPEVPGPPPIGPIASSSLGTTASTLTATPEQTPTHLTAPLSAAAPTSRSTPLPNGTVQDNQPQPAGFLSSFFKSYKPPIAVSTEPIPTRTVLTTHNPLSSTVVHTQDTESGRHQNDQAYQSKGSSFFSLPPKTPATLSSSHPQPSLTAVSPYYSLHGLHLPQVPNIVSPSDVPSERERGEIELIKLLIYSYFTIVRKNVADYVPKSIMSFMVNTAKDVIQRELVSQLYRQELFSDLLQEGEEVADARKQCKATLQTLRNAMVIINQIRDFDLDEF